MEAHELVAQVHDRYTNIAAKVARIIGVSPEFIRSHHREPKLRNPLASGNTSPVTHYIEYCHQYEAAERGAGRLLSNRVHASLNAEFDEDDILTQSEHFDNITDETCDVQKWLAKFDLGKASTRELASFEQECSEAIDALLSAKTRARALKRQKEAGLKMVVR